MTLMAAKCDSVANGGLPWFVVERLPDGRHAITGRPLRPHLRWFRAGSRLTQREPLTDPVIAKDPTSADSRDYACEANVSEPGFLLLKCPFSVSLEGLLRSVGTIGRVSDARRGRGPRCRRFRTRRRLLESQVSGSRRWRSCQIESHQ